MDKSRKKKLLQVSMDAATDLSDLAELMDFSVGNMFSLSSHPTLQELC